MGRPKGSKNTPKRTLDLRDYIPPPAPKFKITSSQRKLLKSFNPEGLPDFRSKEFKQLSYDDKENYILEQLAIAQENRKNEKTKLKLIGDVNFNYIVYNLDWKEYQLEKELRKNKGYNKDTILTDEEQREIIKKLDEWSKKAILYELKRNNILIDNFNSDLYNQVFELSIKINGEFLDFNKRLEYKYNTTYTNKKIKETSLKDGYENYFYFRDDMIINYNMEVNKNKINDYIKCLILASIKIGSGNLLIFINNNYKNNYNIDEKKIKKYQEIKMKDASSYNLEDYDNQDWDSKKGRCVFDYIIDRYGNIKGFKLACNDEELIKIFNDKDALIDGVDTYQINNFCEKFNVPLYAYDENNNLFHHYYPNKKSNVPSMMFKIINNHFYPIPEKQRKGYVNNKNNLNIYSNLYNESKEEEKKVDEEEVIINLNKNENSLIVMGEMMKESKRIPNVSMYNGKITSIKLNKIKYFFNDDNENIEKIVLNMGLDYIGQSIGELVSIIIKDKIKFSNPNINIYNQLIQAKKNRAFNGLIKDFNEKDNLIAYDINKCYSSILYNPIEEWILLDVNNEWEDFDGDYNNIKLGLYFIETDDNLLFKGNNIYSSSIIKKAIEEKIKFRIINVLYPDKKQSKNLFVDIIDDILKITNNEKELYKLMINFISGMLGRSKLTKTKGLINKSLEQIFITLDNYKNNDTDLKPFMTKIDNTNYYLYGYDKDIKLYENNIPMYIQILDQSNIKLYDMIKKTGGELIGRKTDCAIIKNPINNLITGNKWGDYRLSLIPKLNNYEITNNFNFIYEKDFKEYKTIKDSDEYERILNICLTYGGCLMTGDAGTGKSYVIHKITEILGKDKVAKITPTNKSALNIRGQTIHKFIRVDKKSKISKKTIQKIKNIGLELIIIDEISMINKELWKLLLLLKEETKIKFLLVGDEKQLPPIEDDGIEREYFNSSIVKYLSNYNKIDLKIKKRYDEKLSKILDDIDNIDKKDFATRCETKINICFLNKTRKEVNKYWNNKEKTNEALFIKANEDDEMTQDIYLYSGLPLIARRNTQGGEEMINNEKFILDGYDNEFLYLSSERPDEEGDQTIHKIDVKINDIHKYFLLNYCSTTHKAQGETIKENFTIYDFNLMSKKCKYTALSRAKSAEQIIINGEIIQNKKIVALAIEQKPIIKDNNNIVISHRKEEEKAQKINETEYYLYEYNNMIRELNKYELNYYDNYKISNLLNIINEKYYKYINKKYNIIIDDKISLHQYYLFINKRDLKFELINKKDKDLHSKYIFITCHLNYNIEKMEEFINYLEKL